VTFDHNSKGQGHMRHLKVGVHILVSALLLTYALMDYHITWYKCSPHLNHVQWPWPRSIPQRSRSTAVDIAVLWAALY